MKKMSWELMILLCLLVLARGVATGAPQAKAKPDLVCHQEPLRPLPLPTPEEEAQLKCGIGGSWSNGCCVGAPCNCLRLEGVMITANPGSSRRPGTTWYHLLGLGLALASGPLFAEDLEPDACYRVALSKRIHRAASGVWSTDAEGSSLLVVDILSDEILWISPRGDVGSASAIDFKSLAPPVQAPIHLVMRGGEYWLLDSAHPIRISRFDGAFKARKRVLVDLEWEELQKAVRDAPRLAAVYQFTPMASGTLVFRDLSFGADYDRPSAFLYVDEAGIRQIYKDDFEVASPIGNDYLRNISYTASLGETSYILYLDPEKPYGKQEGKASCWMINLDVRNGAELSRVLLPTAATHLTVVPGDFWSFIEKKAVEPLGEFDAPFMRPASMKLVSSAWPEEPSSGWLDAKRAPSVSIPVARRPPTPRSRKSGDGLRLLGL